MFTDLVVEIAVKKNLELTYLVVCFRKQSFLDLFVEYFSVECSCGIVIWILVIHLQLLHIFMWIIFLIQVEENVNLFLDSFFNELNVLDLNL
jgi:hypothetical protein